MIKQFKTLIIVAIFSLLFTSGMAIGADFDANSDVFTNNYIGLKQVGDKWILTGEDGTERVFEVISKTAYKGVKCLEIKMWERGAIEGNLYIAQDIYGATRIIGFIDKNGTELNVSPDKAGTLVTANPQIEEWYYRLGPNYPDGEKVEVVAMNYPAASSGVSKRKMFILCAASGGELNPQRSIKRDCYNPSWNFYRLF